MDSPISLIDRRCFAELDLILWDRSEHFIPADEAFYAYEVRWRYVDQAKLKENELALISQLTKEIGKGMFLSA